MHPLQNLHLLCACRLRPPIKRFIVWRVHGDVHRRPKNAFNTSDCCIAIESNINSHFNYICSKCVYVVAIRSKYVMKICTDAYSWFDKRNPKFQIPSHNFSGHFASYTTKRLRYCVLFSSAPKIKTQKKIFLIADKDRNNYDRSMLLIASLNCIFVLFVVSVRMACFDRNAILSMKSVVLLSSDLHSFSCNTFRDHKNENNSVVFVLCDNTFQLK